MSSRSPARSAALEELDDAIKAAGGTATLVPLDLKDYDGIDRLGAALNERYGKLDILVGNAGMLGALSPLEPCRAEGLGRGDGGQRHRQLAADPLARPAAAEVRRRARGVRHLGRRLQCRRAYWGPYAVSKAALEVLARTYAAETATTHAARQPVQSRPDPHPHARDGDAGRGPDDARHAGELRREDRRLCLPGYSETGTLYNYRVKKFLELDSARVTRHATTAAASSISPASRNGAPGSVKPSSGLIA